MTSAIKFSHSSASSEDGSLKKKKTKKKLSGEFILKLRHNSTLLPLIYFIPPLPDSQSNGKSLFFILMIARLCPLPLIGIAGPCFRGLPANTAGQVAYDGNRPLRTSGSWD